MGHGTPIASGDRPGSGVAAPFMLDVGLSSTHELAQAWKLEAPDRPARHVYEPNFTLVTPKDGDRVDSPPYEGSRGYGIRETIENALRSAGLLR
jgi:hypothetical protein